MLRINDIQRLYLGIQGENMDRTLTIDVRDWLVRYPNGSISIWHKRHGESTPQPTGASMDASAGTVTWEPTNVDTYYSGEGEAEFRLAEDNVIKKTKKVITGVSPAVTAAGQTLGSDWQSYIDEVERYKNVVEQIELDVDAAKEAAKTSEAYAVGKRGDVDVESTDPAYHNNSKYYSEQAGSSATAADTSAKDAEAYAIGKRGGTDVGSSDPAYHNNSKYYQGLAESAKNTAVAAKDQVLGMTATASGLPAGSDPTVSYSGGTMAFGIPKGDTGTADHVYIKYASAQPSQDSDMKDTADEWIGVHTGTESSAPAHYTDYTWYKYKGETGTADHVYIKYASAQPTQDSDMKDTADEWIGIHTGTESSAPAHYTDYTWFKIKGETGSAANVYGNTVPMSSSDTTKVSEAIGAKLSTNQGAGNSGKALRIGSGGDLAPESVDTAPTQSSTRLINSNAVYETLPVPLTLEFDNSNGASDAAIAITKSGNFTDYKIVKHEITGENRKKVASGVAVMNLGSSGLQASLVVKAGQTATVVIWLAKNENLTWSGPLFLDTMSDEWTMLDKLKNDVAIVEDGNTATHNISSGKYVCWKGSLYKANQAISSGDSLSSSTNLDAVSNGLGGELSTLSEQIVSLTSAVNSKSKILVETKQMGGTGTVAAGSTKDVSLDVTKQGYKPVGIIGYTGSGTGNFAMQEIYVTVAGAAHYFVRNISGSSNAISYLNVDVLYVKT